MIILDYFLNDKYKLVKVIFDNYKEKNSNSFASITQKDLQKITGYSAGKVNDLISSLVQDHIIEEAGSKRYVLSVEAIKLLKNIEKKRSM